MMVVVVAAHLPPAVRGRMKLWFIEAKPNVFVSGIKDAVADEVIEYLFTHCPQASGLAVFQQISTAPGYRIRTLGTPERQLIFLSGMPLMKEPGRLA
jgi:CRISPR-associated protein Cas2